jgi:hypothetical protein
MGTNRKSAIRNHAIPCTQEDKIAYLIDSTTKLSIIITGDGHPEEGMSERLSVIHERQQGVRKTLEAIDKNLIGVNSNYNVLLTEITGVGKKLAVLKEGIKTVTDAKDKNFSKTTKIIMIVIAAIGCLFAYQKLDKGQTDIKGQATKIETKVENQGIPFVTNSRGEILALPDSTKIMFWPNDSAKYIIKKDK